MITQTLAIFYNRPATTDDDEGGQLDISFTEYCRAYLELVRSRRTIEIYSSSRKMSEHTTLWMAKFDYKLAEVHEGMVAHLPYTSKVVAVDGAVYDQFEDRRNIIVALVDNISLVIPDGAIPNFTQS